MPQTALPILDRHAIEALLAETFPQLYEGGRSFTVEEVGPMTSRLRLHVSERHLRPGGTISGPSIFALADVALYVAILAQIGPVTLAVTTNLTLNFLRKPPPSDLVGTCRLLKLGRRLAVGEVTVATEGDDRPVAHATGTYSIPPRGNDAVA
jgi:uncharacterized protein (TIGR00369 family)